MRAMIAQSFHHIINTFKRKVLWQTDGRDMNIAQAVGFMTGGAIEMHMQVVHVAIAIATTYGIFQ